LELLENNTWIPNVQKDNNENKRCLTDPVTKLKNIIDAYLKQHITLVDQAPMDEESATFNLIQHLFSFESEMT
jgi:hypothetical protein